jgi:hypothetical protein
MLQLDFAIISKSLVQDLRGFLNLKIKNAKKQIKDLFFANVKYLTNILVFQRFLTIAITSNLRINAMLN